jgi:peptidoglycan/LPS O-acetylase OafA/YrhL
MKKHDLLHVPSLDGVRAIAALMVMFFHFFQNLTPNNTGVSLLKTLSSFGQTGVSLFFVLSGFLITRILIREKSQPDFFRNFYFRRSLRIFPLYYFYLTLVFVIIPLISHVEIPAFSKQIYHWVYLQDFAITFHWNYAGPIHFWSLAVEEHFYLFFPLLVYFLSEKKLVYALAALILSSITVRYFLTKAHFEVFYFTFSRLDELVLGAILAILEINKKLTADKAARFMYLFIFVAMPTLVLWVVYSKDANDVLQVVKYILISLCYFSIIGYIVALNEHHIIKKTLSIKPLLFIGKISYGLYVYHGICFNLITVNNLCVKFFGSFILTILVSSVSFYFFESYFLRFKNYFIDRRSL